MTVRPIRSTSRYAVRLPLRLGGAGRKACRGLLIELSLDGARISGLGELELSDGQEVSLAIKGSCKLGGTVRWSRAGVAGIKLDVPLHVAELEALLDFNQASQQDLPCNRNALPRYGT